MEKVYYTTKRHVTNFKLDYCCWFAPVRVGLMLVGYINIIIDLVCIIGIANDGLSPTIVKVQDILISDFVSKPVPVLAYVIELAFNVVLLSAVFRRDVVLLRVFMYYTFIAVLMSIMTYSIVLAAVPFHIQLAIVLSILFQAYCILVIRSVIVEWKNSDQKYELPRMVMSSLLKDRATPVIYDPSNGTIQEITVSEVPKKQEVQITVIDEKNKDQKAAENKNVTEPKNNSDAKRDVEVKVQIESKNKVEKKSEHDKRKEEKKAKDDKKREEKKAKEDKKKNKEVMKKDEKNNKEENKKEESELKDNKEKKSEKNGNEISDDEKIITALILQKYKEEKLAEQEAKAKDLKET